MNWTPTGTVDEAEGEYDDIPSGIIDRYVKCKTPKRNGPTPWWNSKCEKAYKWKLKTFKNKKSHPLRYQAAIKFNRMIQKKAFKAHQERIKVKLINMPSSDTNFWQLAKEIGGLVIERSQAAPSAQIMADHFGIDEVEYPPPDGHRIPLMGFKIRYRDVLRMLKNMNRNKSANGVPPRFWKICAEELASSVTKLYQYIVKKKKHVSR